MSRFSRLSRPVYFLLCCVLASSAFAVGEGRLDGTVLDSSAKPVAGATIILTRQATQYRQEKRSDAEGRFRVLILDARVKYHIHIEKEHFLPFDDTVAPLMGDTLRVEFTLKPDTSAP